MSSRWRESPAYTLGTRLAGWYAVLFVGSSVAIAVLTYVLLASSLKQRDRELIRSTLVSYASQYEQRGLSGLERAIRDDQAAARGERLFVRVSSGGAEISFYNLPGDIADYDLSDLQSPRARNGELWAHIPRRGTSEFLEVQTAMLPNGTLLQVGKSTESRDELLARYRTVLLLAVAIVIFAGGLGGALLTRSTMQPLHHLAGVVETILQTGRFEARVPVRASSDPLDRLASLFNGMLDRIVSLIAGMRGSLDNVAHDLRTPMTRLRGIAERALEADGDDPARYREALADVLEESERVSEMLNTLMDISEAETGVMRLTIEPLSTDDVVREAIELYSDVAEDKAITLEAEVQPGLTVFADHNRLRQVLANLVDNAVKYTPAGGRVTVRAHASGDGLALEVVDTGPGIPPEDLPRVWDRLFRGDRSRSERGLGLGLSLVRAIVEAHKGRAEVMAPPGRGTTFTVWLPDGSSTLASARARGTDRPLAG
jgi:signal transduction histidine kinase